MFEEEALEYALIRLGGDAVRRVSQQFKNSRHAMSNVLVEKPLSLSSTIITYCTTTDFTDKCTSIDLTFTCRTSYGVALTGIRSSPSSAISYSARAICLVYCSLLSTLLMTLLIITASFVCAYCKLSATQHSQPLPRSVPHTAHYILVHTVLISLSAVSFRMWASAEGSPAYLQGVANELAGKRMLLVKGSERPASMIAGMCEQWGMHTTLARNLAEVEGVLKSGEHIDVVLVDYELDNTAAIDDPPAAQPPAPLRTASLADSTFAEDSATAASDALAASSAAASAAAARPTGLDVAQLVRRMFPVGSSPTVMMLCALSQRQRSMRTVVDAFLSKPVKPSKLFAALVAAQRPKLSAVMMGAATANSGSPVLHPSSLPPLAPFVGWQSSIEGMTTPSRQSQGPSGVGTADQSLMASPDLSSYTIQQSAQQQPPNGKRKRDSLPADANNVSPPAGFFTIASSPSHASSTAQPALPTTATNAARPPKQNRLSASSTGMSSASTSPTLGDDSRLFFQKHPMRILAAEDNLINQKVLAKMLDRLGWPKELVTIVPNGKLAWDGVAAAVDDPRATAGPMEAAPAGGDSEEETAALRRRLQHEPYHLVFMDLFMPVLDGLEATTSIRTDTRISANAQPYIVALTANAMTGDKHKCLGQSISNSTQLFAVLASVCCALLLNGLCTVLCCLTESGMEFFLSKVRTLHNLISLSCNYMRSRLTPLRGSHCFLTRTAVLLLIVLFICLSKPVTLGPLMQALRTGFAAMCKKRKQMLARQQREDGNRLARQRSGDGGGGGSAAGDVTPRQSSAAAGSSVASIAEDSSGMEGQTAGAELRRRGVEQLIISPSLRPHKLSQLNSTSANPGYAYSTTPPQHTSNSNFSSPSSSTVGRLSSAAFGTSPSSAPSHVLMVNSHAAQLISDLPSSMSFARFSSAPLSSLTGRMLATSHQLQLLATLGHGPNSPLLNADGDMVTTGGGVQMESVV